MKLRFRFIAIFALSAFITGPVVSWSADSPEDQQIAILKSNNSLKEKDAACVVLKRAGTERSIPALAALLRDENLSHSARYALESMPYPEAEKALVEAVDHTSGLLKAGILHSLAVRRDPAALPVVSKALSDKDPAVVIAAALLAGRIGNAETLQTLESAAASSIAKKAVIQGILSCATQLNIDKQGEIAFKAFEHLYSTEKEESIRLAAYRGMILSAGNKATELMVQGIEGQDGPCPIRRSSMRQARQGTGGHPGVDSAVSQIEASGANCSD